MKRLLLLLLLAPTIALAGGARLPSAAEVARVRDRKFLVGTWALNATVTHLQCYNPAAGCWGKVLESSVRITDVTLYVNGASDGGAGTTTITVTDGTNWCAAAFACASTGTTRAKSAAGVATGGAGCSFPAGASVFAYVATDCATTQPTIGNVDILGVYQ